MSKPNVIDAGLSFRGGLSRRSKTTRIIVHHAEASEASPERIHSWHLGNGWAGAGYHYYVRKDGTVYSMRPEWAIGSHALGSNSDSIGVCFEGNYMTETMPKTQLWAGRDLIAWLKAEYGIDTVQRHRDVCATNCPGDNFPFEVIVGGQKPKKEDDLKPVSNEGGDVYRLYNPNSGFHHFTLSTIERDALVQAGWNYEKVAWTAPRGGTVAIYRLYDQATGDHFYTADLAEAQTAQAGGYEYEGVPFFGADSGAAVLRLCNPNSGEHFYTLDAGEKDALVAAGWRDEGIGWYAK